MFRLYVCCESDNWKPVRMDRVPGQGFRLYRVLPPAPPSASFHKSPKKVNSKSPHASRRYFYMVHVVDLKSHNAAGEKQRENAATSSANRMLCFVKENSSKVDYVTEIPQTPNKTLWVSEMRFLSVFEKSGFFVLVFFIFVSLKC